MIRIHRPFQRRMHKLHFDNNTELTLSRLRIYHCAPLIEAIDPFESRITNASSQSMSLSRILCALTLNNTMPPPLPPVDAPIIDVRER